MLFRVVLIVLFGATSAFAEIRAFYPENNNSCPHLSPPFESVIFSDPSLRCGDAHGVRQVIFKLDRWLPERIGRPRIALVMDPKGAGAYYSSYALRVPLLLGGTGSSPRDHGFSLFPNHVSRAVVAHEYGHAMLAHALAATNALAREDLEMVRAYTRHWVIRQVHEQRSRKMVEELIAKCVALYGPEETWTPGQRNEVLAARRKLYDNYLERAEEILKFENSARARITSQVSARDEARAPYHEFFADLVGVLDAGDWAIMGKAIFTITGDARASTPRDFTNPANSFEAVETGSNRFEAHDLLGPARFLLFKRLRDNRCLKPNPSLLIAIMLDAIRDQIQSPVTRNNPKTIAEREAINRRFVNDIFWRMDRAGAALCR